jgi:hypothetical protein
MHPGTPLPGGADACPEDHLGGGVLRHRPGGYIAGGRIACGSDQRSNGAGIVGENQSDAGVSGQEDRTGKVCAWVDAGYASDPESGQPPKWINPTKMDH